MNIRDYWLLKLPEVRKQSPTTGRLVESLLMNENSNITNMALKNVAILSNYNIKLQEISVIAQQKIEERMKQSTADINNLYIKIRNNKADKSDIDNLKVLEKEFDGFKEHYAKLNININQTSNQSKETLNTNQTNNQSKETSNTSQTSNQSNKLPSNQTNTSSANKVAPNGIKQIFEKILNLFKKLFESSKVLFKKFWNRFFTSKTDKYSIAFIIAVCIFMSILYGVHVYQKSKSIGSTIIKFIIRLAVALVAGMALFVFVKSVYGLISNLFTHKTRLVSNL